MAETLRRQATASVQWQAATAAFQALARFTVGVALARMLAPADFGIVGFALIFSEFLTMFSELGIGSALVQRESLTDTHLRVGFTLSALLGTASALLLWLAAPYVAAGNNPSVIRAVSLSLLLTSLGTVSTALLYRRLEFRRLFFVELFSYLLGYALVTIILAWRGYGAWSLVGGILVQVSVRLLLVSVSAGHTRGLSFAGQEVRELLHFGTGLTLARLANYAARTADQFLVGRLLGPAALGLYLRATALGSMSSGYFSSAVTTVVFPLYARIQGDAERTRRWYLLSNNLVALFSFPSMALVIVTAPEILRAVYGPQWIEATVPLQVCALAGIFRSLFTLSDALARAHARVYSQFVRHAMFALLVVIGTYAGLPFGLVGVTSGVLLAVLTMWAVMARLSLELTKAKPNEFLGCLRAGAVLGLAVASASAAVVWMLRVKQVADMVVLAVAFAVAGVTMVLAFRALPHSWISGVAAVLHEPFARFIPRTLLNWVLGPSPEPAEGRIQTP